MVADLRTLDLASQSLGEFINVFDDPGILVRSCLVLYVILEFLGKFRRRRISLCQDYRSLYHLAPDGIGSAGNGRLYDSRMCQECAFYLERTDTVS